MPLILVKNHPVELHETIQKLQSNDDRVNDNTLILASQNFEEDKDEGLCLQNNDENDKTNEILYKKQKSHFSLHHKNLKKTKDGIWGKTRTMKSMKLCCV